MSSPVSSRTSRRRPSSMVSPSSRRPPGGSQWPLSARRMRRARSWSSVMTAATLTECLGLVVFMVITSGVAYSPRRVHELRSTGLATASVLAEAVDPSSDRAVYRQIADHLRAAIGRERLGPGDQLPSEAPPMAHHRVAPATAHEARPLPQTE